MEHVNENMVASNLSIRLREARAASGMTTRDVASKPSVKISHTTLANYERGVSSPPVEVLTSLSQLYGKPLEWFLREGPGLRGVKYRYYKSKLTKSDVKRYEANAARLLEAYVLLERRLNRPLRATGRVMATAGEEPKKLASRIRKELKFGEDVPIPSAVDILQRFGIRTIELPTELSIDGLAARYGDEDVVIMNPSSSNDRGRMIALHELIHVLYGDCTDDAPETKEQETRAFEGASHLLLPDSQLEKAFKGESMVRLVRFKETFGISLAAMIMRAQRASIINETTSKWLWIEFTKRGWRKTEPGFVRPDRATRFEQLIDTAISSSNLTWSDLSHITGLQEAELRERRNLALGHAHDEGEGGETDGEHVLKFRRE
jgi:Zn-dependent peptidase ImmA (M78 family)/transcriptional regulator with XRE-family HTH domain